MMASQSCIAVAAVIRAAWEAAKRICSAWRNIGRFDRASGRERVNDRRIREPKSAPTSILASGFRLLILSLPSPLKPNVALSSLLKAKITLEPFGKRRKEFVPRSGTKVAQQPSERARASQSFFMLHPLKSRLQYLTQHATRIHPLPRRL